MKSSTITSVKYFLNRAIFFGVIGAAVAFLVVLYQPKQYLVVGKMVVFPSGGSASAEKNLGFETGNTVQIINSSAFKENTFQGNSNNFAHAKQLGNSSTIAISFYASQSGEKVAEDSIVRVPAAVADYARDLYSGMPFKYKLISDPEISVGPVKPNLSGYLSGGFGIGILLYFLYWFLFEFLRIPIERQEEIPAEKEEKKEKSTPVKLAEKKIGAGQIVMENDRPHFVPGEISAMPEKKIISPISSSNGAAPENLPIAGGEIASSDIQEPSDEEVKERLNRLMRGEL